MSEENKNEELTALTAEAAAIDAANAPQPAQQAQSVPVAPSNEVPELSALFQIVSGLFAPMFPSLSEIYTAETCDRIASAAVPVMVKRGWSMSGVMGKYGEEVALLAVAAPVALMTYKGVMSDIEAMKKKPAEPTQSATVTKIAQPPEEPQFVTPA